MLGGITMAIAEVEFIFLVLVLGFGKLIIFISQYWVILVFFFWVNGSWSLYLVD